MNEILALFCTYLDKQDRRITWDWDNRLKPNMTSLINQHPDWDEYDWVRYFVQLWRNSRDDLARRHLICYLDKPLRRAANQVYFQRIQPNLEQHPELPQSLSLCDVIQIGREFTCNLEWILRRYDVNRPLYPYARRRLTGRIIDHISRNDDSDSDWALLRDSSPSRVQRALQQYFGCNSSQLIDNHVLAWQCFRELYHPPTPSAFSPLREPADEELEGMAQLFSQLSGNSITSQQINSDLNTIISALRDFTNQQILPYDAPINAEDSTTWIDTIEDESNPDIESIWINENAQELLQDLPEIIGQLSNRQQALSFCRFGLNYTYSELNQTFAIQHSYYQINHRILPNICQLLINWSIEKCNITSDSVDINYVQTILNSELLSQYYQRLILNLFDSVSISLNLPGEEVTEEQLVNVVVKYLSELGVTFSEGSLTILRNRLQPLIDLWRSINDNYQP